MLCVIPHNTLYNNDLSTLCATVIAAFLGHEVDLSLLKPDLSHSRATIAFSSWQHEVHKVCCARFVPAVLDWNDLDFINTRFNPRGLFSRGVKKEWLPVLWYKIMYFDLNATFIKSDMHWWRPFAPKCFLLFLVLMLLLPNETAAVFHSFHVTQRVLNWRI